MELPQLFHTNPLPFKPTSFGLKGWTDTVAGYLYEADKLSRCIVRNLKGTDTALWAVTICLEEELSPAAITAHWSKACRNLRRHGLTAIWVREPTRRNRIHYHLIVTNDIRQAELKRIIETSLPPRSEVRYHKQVKRVESLWCWCRYITKAKKAGWVNGRWVEDTHWRKRLLFRPNLGLRKHGTIGSFWQKPKKVFWAEICETERAIAEGLEQAGVRKLARHVYELLDGTVSLKRIERAFGKTPNHPAVKQWVESYVV